MSSSDVSHNVLDGLLGPLRESRRRWRKLGKKELRAAFQELQSQREHLIRQEDQHPPNDPLRLAFQCQRAVVDLHILELGKVAAGSSCGGGGPGSAGRSGGG